MLTGTQNFNSTIMFKTWPGQLRFELCCSFGCRSIFSNINSSIQWPPVAHLRSMLESDLFSFYNSNVVLSAGQSSVQVLSEAVGSSNHSGIWPFGCPALRTLVFEDPLLRTYPAYWNVTCSAVITPMLFWVPVKVWPSFVWGCWSTVRYNHSGLWPVGCPAIRTLVLLWTLVNNWWKWTWVR